MRGELPLTDAVTRIRYRTHAFARRQYTWMRRDPRLEWYVLGDDLVAVAGKRVARYLASV